MYTKLNEQDKVVSLLAMNPYNEMLLYNNTRVLRLPGNSAPLLNRSTKGNIGISTNKHPAAGIVCIYPEADYLVSVSESGYINKIKLETVPVGKRGQAGVSVMKLNKGDTINSIFVCTDKDALSIFTKRAGEKLIAVSDIPIGSTLSPGNRLIDASGILATSIKRG
jgi:DNA gyrase/topoisomerase IV subunit A